MASTTIYKCADCSMFFSTMSLISSHSCTHANKFSKTTFVDNHNCAESNEETRPKDVEGCYSQDTESNVGNGIDGIWTRAPTLYLIEQYAMKKDLMDRGKLKKKDFWKHVSEELGKHDDKYTFTPEQVNGRWKTLQRNYKSTKNENKKSVTRSSDRKDFEFMTEMDEIFSKDPAITPKATSSSATGSCKRTIDSEDSDEPRSDQMKKKRKSQSQEFIDFLTSYVDSQNKKHAEEMAVRKKQHEDKIDILRVIANSLNK